MTLTPYAQNLSPEDAAHFVRRTRFGGTDAEIRALVGKDARAVARAALDFDQTRAARNPFDPATGATPGAMIQLTRAGWLYEMIYGPHPLREKLALTWSNHFVVGTDKVRNESSLRQYLTLLRRHAATRRFEEFTLDVARTPAMLRYLDNDQNRKGKPNENFSRELLELFTTGIGHYTEKDVQEGARALSGWTFTGGRGNKNFLEEARFEYQKNRHDPGEKTYLGQTGKFEPQDIVRLAAQHPQTAVFIARKLHRAFVADTPDEKAVQGSAETFRRTHGDLRAVLEELLSSEAFYGSRQRIIRGPVEYIVGALRTLGRPELAAKRLVNLAQLSGRMGQQILEPDTVKGWDGGREWINDSTLLLRMNLAASLTLSKDAPQVKPPTNLALTGSERDLLRAELGKLNDKQRTYLTMISPEFQLA
ncbi:DUF1800 domain-containing protein [Deinococcus fonticola]|uniref:DUF1800 domain-containing protein n=1 Tax=Deinococcus fonticola TaxID=2528713 RepID=UPI001074F93D|nr:DUF1800 domain-containing protein [Deinococcus fonticola]